MPGSRMSNKAKSGIIASSLAKASSPLPASITLCPERSKSMRTAKRMSASSSMTRMFAINSPQPSLVFDRQPDFHRRAFSGLAFINDLAAVSLRQTLGDRHTQSHVGGPGGEEGPTHFLQI